MRQMLDRVHAQVKQFLGLAGGGHDEVPSDLRHELNAVVRALSCSSDVLVDW